MLNILGFKLATGRWAEVITADVVVVDATIYTSDPVLPFAEAMAIRNGRILRVGNYSDIKVTPYIFSLFLGFLCLVILLFFP